MYDTILSPIDYGGMQLKNRIIFAPTTFGLSDEEYLAEMERLAKGGCAMIIIGDVPVAKSRFEKSLFDKKGFAFYQQICETAHKYGCKVCAQLHQTDTDMMSIIKCIPGMLMKKITPDQLRERMNSGACSSFSSRRTCWVRAEGVMKSRSAAFVRLFSSAMATTYSNSFRFIKHPSGVLRCSCRAVSAKSARYDTIIHDFGRSVQKKEENCLGI